MCADLSKFPRAFGVTPGRNYRGFQGLRPSGPWLGSVVAETSRLVRHPLDEALDQPIQLVPREMAGSTPGMTVNVPAMPVNLPARMANAPAATAKVGARG